MQPKGLTPFSLPPERKLLARHFPTRHLTSWGRKMSGNDKAACYRLYSAHCVDFARHLSDPGINASILSMAQSWRALADQADNNSDVVLVYETPYPRATLAQPGADEPS
jgi:hypothetical protein